ncbi:MAG: MraY family glycosyltransferase, partial [bacterium]
LTALFFALVAGVREQFFVATLASVTAGVAAGFLLHNRPPATIFMGDAGSHFLGFTLAVLGILTTYYAPDTTPTPAPVLIPLLILAVPILDLIAVVIMRIRSGKPVHVGDHTHISHRFESMGFSRARSVLLVYLLVFTTGASGVFLVWVPAVGVVLALLQAAAVISAVGILQYTNPSPTQNQEASKP